MNGFRFSRLLTLIAIPIFSLSIFTGAFAEEEETPKTDPPKAEARQFEIIDGTAAIGGEPGHDTKFARAKWQTACDAWKTETKDLNKSNQVVSLACGSADCTYQENGNYVCTSTASYKIKTEGVRAPPAPTPVGTDMEKWVKSAPPPAIAEIQPAPQVGFIWAPGYWGWSGHRHNWYPGHWMHQPPGQIWIGNQWNHRGDRWYFQSGHWRH